VVTAIEADGGTAVAVQADVAVEADVKRLFAETAAKLGPVTALVNNAGIRVPVSIADVTPEQLLSVFSTNAFGAILCAREAVQRMSTKRGGGGGVIVNVSSVAALFGGMAGDVVYAGSKAAVDAMTLGLAREVAGQGIRVCGVRPGITATEMWDDGDVSLAEVERSVHSLVPLARVGTPEEIAGAVLWLCSPAASYVTGTLLNVSGGREIDIPPGS
jgi:NAD(P)-dependent dehydrogenase (short-subunit alcohol dehydrogenase family)